MLRQTDESLLADGGAVRCDKKSAYISADLRQQFAQGLAVVVLADDSEANRNCAKRGDIRGDRGRSAAAAFGARNFEHRHRRLGAYPLGVAVNIDVEHQVSDNQNSRSSQIRYSF